MPFDKDYPDSLRAMTSPPPQITVVGKLLKQDSCALAIVGTRTPTNYGKKVAREFTKYFVQQGITIISGLARGIDTIAHETAIKEGGRTIAVLGSGVNTIYPPENRLLYNEISKHGAVISQFHKDAKPLGKHFLARNRLIAGLSVAVVVIEGQKKSGTLSTATHAANLGKDVFAVPGEISNPYAGAPNYLISQGATIALNPELIVDTTATLLFSK